MRRLSIAAVLTVWLLPTSQARAGLYNTDEPLLNVLLNAPQRYPELLLYLQQVVAVELTGNSDSSRFKYLERVRERERKLADGKLSLRERTDLSADYVRLNEPTKAVELLEAVPHKQRDWRLLSNLATAYQLKGNLERAEAYLMDALEKWPTVAPDPNLNSWRLNWLWTAEQHQLRLIRSRLREQRSGGGPAATIDAIFPGFRPVGPSGEYEPGVLANDQWAKLPALYMETVKLLVLWMPHDARLRWLLAELENVNGHAETALTMMDELSDTRGFRNAEFAEHQLILRHAKDVAEHLFKLKQEFADEHAANPLPLVAALLPPGPDAALNAGNTALALRKIVQTPLPKGELLVASDIPTPPATKESPTPNLTLEWRQITGGFVVGVIVALLLSMQLQMRKRKQDAAPAAKE
jgi:hypothetical protein